MNGTHEDDWFSEPAVAESPARAAEPLEDDWLAELPPRRRSRVDRQLLLNRRLLVSVAAVLVLVVALLAATGAFNSSTPQPTTTPTTGITTPTTSATTTAPAANPGPRVAAPTSTLSPGDRRAAEVRTLQRALASLGYSVGTADGSYGPTTEQAVAAFQRAKGLTADGILGSKTLRALKLALAGS